VKHVSVRMLKVSSIMVQWLHHLSNLAAPVKTKEWHRLASVGLEGQKRGAAITRQVDDTESRKQRLGGRQATA
jgi:hypothetical protein